MKPCSWYSYIGTEHILLGLIREGEGVGTQVLIKMDVDLGELRSATIDMIRGNSGTGTGDGKGDLANAGGVTDKQNKSGSAILDQFGRNLTAEAAEGKLGRSSAVPTRLSALWSCFPAAPRTTRC